MTLLCYLWAGPNTLLGLAAVLLARTTGGGWSVHSGVVEAHGGAVAAVLRRMPLVRGAAALTLGHVVLGQTPDLLDVTRAHERVHVRQYERWGPFFLPAYALASLYAALRGRDPYRDNPFERAAYGST